MQDVINNIMFSNRGLGFFQITVSFDETTTLDDVDNLFKVFSNGKTVSIISLYSILSEMIS